MARAFCALTACWLAVCSADYCRSDVLPSSDSASPATGEPAGRSGESAASTKPARRIREVPLPSYAGFLNLAVDVGGGGRLLAMYFPDLGKLGVFDVRQAKMVRYLFIGRENVRIAAGRTKLLVSLPSKGIIQRWDLLTGEKELTGKLPHKGGCAIAMGSDTDERVLVWVNWAAPRNEALAVLDVGSLRPLPMKRTGLVGCSTIAHFRSSADGRLCGFWSGDRRISSCGVAEIRGDEIVFRLIGPNGPRGPIPSADGSAILSTAKMATPDLAVLSEFSRFPPRHFFPATQGAYVLGFTPRVVGSVPWLKKKPAPSTIELSVHVVGRKKALLDLDPIPRGLTHVDRWGDENAYYFVPSENVLVVISPKNNRLLLVPLDMEYALQKTGADYLYVACAPDGLARKGRLYRGTVTTVSKGGKAVHSLERGPLGMRVSSSGTILWNVPADFGVNSVPVVLKITGASGQEIRRTFTIRVE